MRTNRRGFLTGLATLAAAARAKGEALEETKETGKAPKMHFSTSIETFHQTKLQQHKRDIEAAILFGRR